MQAYVAALTTQIISFDKQTYTLCQQEHPGQRCGYIQQNDSMMWCCSLRWTLAWLSDFTLEPADVEFYYVHFYEPP